MVSASQDALPLLRQNIGVFQQQEKSDQPAKWVLHDKVKNQFFRIGYLEFLILSLWDLKSFSAIQDELKDRYALDLTQEHFNEFSSFLIENQLVVNQSENSEPEKDGKPKITEVLADILKVGKLFFLRLPLCQPDKSLTKLISYVSWLFSSWFTFLMMIVVVVGVVGVIRNFDAYQATFFSFFNLQGLMLWVGAIIVVKIVHECAHALTAKFYGCYVSTIGVALLFFWPVMYTDVTNAWQVKGRRKRVRIAAAGVISELYLAGVASLIWLLTDGGIVHSVAFFISGTSLIASLLINLNPFLKFDGYYMLSDALGITNLHDKAIHFADRSFDKCVFGFCEENQYAYLAVKQQKFLTVFGYLLWLYRFLLMATISLFLYSVAFKFLAFALIAVYVINSIIMPAARKIKRLKTKFRKIMRSTHFWRNSMFLMLLLLYFILPTKSDIHVPAILEASKFSGVYTTEDAYIVQRYVTHGNKVKKGDVLFELYAPSLVRQLESSREDIAIARWKKDSAVLDNEYRASLQVVTRELSKRETEHLAAVTKQQRLVVKAPHDGIVYIPSFRIEDDQWFKKDELLVEVIDYSQLSLLGYLDEADYYQLDHTIADGYFYPDASPFDRFEIQEIQFSDSGKGYVSELYFASTYGGAIAVRESADNSGEMATEHGVYEVRGVSSHSVKKMEPEFYKKVINGTLVVDSNAYSHAGQIFAKLHANIIKHFSF